MSTPPSAVKMSSCVGLVRERRGEEDARGAAFPLRRRGRCNRRLRRARRVSDVATERRGERTSMSRCNKGLLGLLDRAEVRRHGLAHSIVGHERKAELRTRSSVLAELVRLLVPREPKCSGVVQPGLRFGDSLYEDLERADGRRDWAEDRGNRLLPVHRVGATRVWVEVVQHGGESLKQRNRTRDSVVGWSQTVKSLESRRDSVKGQGQDPKDKRATIARTG